MEQDSIKTKELIYIGTISGEYGIDNSMKLSDVPVNINTIEKNIICRLGFSPSFSEEFKLLSWKKKGRSSIVKLETKDNKLDFFIRKGLFVEASYINVVKGKFLTDDILGSNVFSIDTGLKLGKIIDVWYMPANDVWVVDTEKGELPIPVIDDVVKKVNLAKKEILIKLIPGLLELTEDSENDED